MTRIIIFIIIILLWWDAQHSAVYDGTEIPLGCHLITIKCTFYIPCCIARNRKKFPYYSVEGAIELPILVYSIFDPDWVNE